jgi:hypothetical protein
VVDLGSGVRLDLVLVRAGEFMMCDKKGSEYEKPVHGVVITRPFYRGEFEVAHEQRKIVI